MALEASDVQSGVALVGHRIDIAAALGENVPGDGRLRGDLVAVIILERW